MIAPPARYRKGFSRPGRRRPDTACGLTNTLGKIILPPYFSQAHAPEGCDKERS
jgi:hypothetical protein